MPRGFFSPITICYFIFQNHRLPEVFPSPLGEKTRVWPLFCKLAFSKLGYVNFRLFKLLSNEALAGTISMGDCLLPTFIPGIFSQVAGPAVKTYQCQRNDFATAIYVHAIYGFPAT